MLDLIFYDANISDGKFIRPIESELMEGHFLFQRHFIQPRQNEDKKIHLSYEIIDLSFFVFR